MIHAELYGKASDSNPQHQRSEDVLTSVVFGTLRWLPAQIMYDWFASALPVRGSSRLLDPAEVRVSSLHFWPFAGRRELDALLVLELTDGRADLIAIECKYLSKKSGEALERAVPDIPDQELIAVGDQLADYLNSLRKDQVRTRLNERPTPFPVRHRRLVYITATAVPPHEALDETLQCFSDAKVGADIFWLSWRALRPIVIR